jgi:hypothetical protein
MYLETAPKAESIHRYQDARERLRTYCVSFFLKKKQHQKLHTVGCWISIEMFVSASVMLTTGTVVVQ